MTTITNAQIAALEVAAGEHGDIAQVALCRYALGRDLADIMGPEVRDALDELSPADARLLCEKAIRNGQG